MTLTTTYKGVVIEYDEERELFRLELDGKERTSTTLSGAKKAIEVARRVKEEEKGKPVEAYLLRWNGVYSPVTVTSLAAEPSPRFRGSLEYWITDGLGKKNKAAGDRLLRRSPRNDELIEEIESRSEEINKLNEQIERIRERMERITPADLGIKEE